MFELIEMYGDSPKVIIAHIAFLLIQLLNLLDLRKGWWKKKGRLETVYDRFGNYYNYHTMTRSNEISIANLKIIPVIITGLVIMLCAISGLAVGYLLFLHFILMLLRFGYLASIVWDGGYMIHVPSITDTDFKEAKIITCPTTKFEYYKIFLGNNLRYIKVRTYISDNEANERFLNM